MVPDQGWASHPLSFLEPLQKLPLKITDMSGGNLKASSLQAANSSTKGWTGNTGERGEARGERQTVPPLAICFPLLDCDMGTDKPFSPIRKINMIHGTFSLCQGDDRDWWRLEKTGNCSSAASPDCCYLRTWPWLPVLQEKLDIWILV